MINLIWANLDKIVSALRLNANINNYFDSKIYSGVPPEEITWRNLYIMALPEVINWINSTWSIKLQKWRLAFMIIWADISETDKTLYSIVNVLINELESTCISYNKDFNWFKIESVSPDIISPVMKDVKNRPRIQIDFLFNYIA